MSTPYQRGTAFEHRVRREMEGADFLVTRSPASKSPYDLMAVRLMSLSAPYDLPEIWLVQCKLRGVLRMADALELKHLAVQHGCTPVLAYTLKERGMVHYCWVDDRTQELSL